MESLRRLCQLMFVVVLSVILCGTAPADQAQAPAQPGSYFLPKLAEALTLDGDIAEWDSAVSIPIRYKSHIANKDRNHVWLGPADAGMEFLCAWNDDGLCLAAIVADDDVRNDKEPKFFWHQDGIEIFMDGRTGEQFMKPPFSRGSFQALICAPTPQRGSIIHTVGDHASPEGMKVVGKQTPTGYVIEMLIPFSAFPDLKPQPGSRVGIQAAFDDYDGRDEDSVQPLMMSWRGATALFMSPQKLIAFELVETLPQGPDVPLGTQVVVDAPDRQLREEPIPVAIELGRNIRPKVASVNMAVKDADGKVVAQEAVTLQPGKAPWQGSATGSVEWNAKGVPDGAYTIAVVAKDQAGQPLGIARQSIDVLINAVAEARDMLAAEVARIGEADVAALSQREPFKALAYVGAAACADRAKWLVETGDLDAARTMLDELRARLAVLETGSLPEGVSGLHDLIALSADHEAQVVVEYPGGPKSASVSLYWGAFPLIGARVQLHASAEQAEASKAHVVPGLKNLFTPVTIAGLTGQVRTRSYSFGRADATKLDPSKDVLVYNSQRYYNRHYNWVLDSGDLSLARIEGVVILDSTPKAVRKAVAGWAEREKVPTLTLEEARKKDSALIAGDIGGEKDAEDVLSRTTRRVGMRSASAAQVLVVSGDRTLSVDSPSQAAAKLLAELIVAGKPIAPADVDAIRAALVEALPEVEATPAAEGGMSLYCGDVHMHTFYSDGKYSPIAVALQTMYCGMDYAVITDHNIIDGALLAQRLLGQHGPAHPVIVGEEITMDWAHMNAYPLKKVVSWSLSPYETIKAAHVQGAVIHWCHPGGPDSEWSRAHYDSGIAGTGLAAWEHLPHKYDEWRKAGTLPSIVGSTDSHSGMFDYLERSVVLSPSCSGDDIAEAIRRGKVVMLNARLPNYLYGPDDMIAAARDALANGDELKNAKAEQLKAVLRDVDLAGLLDSSPAEVLEPEMIAAPVSP